MSSILDRLILLITGELSSPQARRAAWPPPPEPWAPRSGGRATRAPGRDDGPGTGSERAPRSSGPSSTSPRPLTFRSVAGERTDGPVFKPDSQRRRAGPPPELSGLHDAFTGAPLDPGRGLFRCRRCSVLYHAESMDVVLKENGGACVACGAAEIEAVARPARGTASGRDHALQIVTLSNYRSFVGQVIVFEGRVVKVLRSRRGTDYAAMFEDTTWARGLKMVAVRGTVGKVGGPIFPSGLVGRTVRVRGLLTHHPIYGDQVTVSGAGMILAVRP